jgi:MoxR-like ATPase
MVLVCLLANGHLLLEDKPGLGKTTLARALAEGIGGNFSRAQCTPDLLPGDITRRTTSLSFGRGPFFLKSCWRMKSIEPPPVLRVRCWKPWRNGR